MINDLAHIVIPENPTQDPVIGLRNAGYSWAEIAARLGVTRQATQQRWRHRQ
jgi:hypothetical protein